MPDQLLCLFCSNKASRRMEKNGEFLSSLNTFWKLTDLDVKPGDNEKFDLCRSCFDELEELHATQEAWVLLKEDLVKCRQKLAEDAQAGLQIRKSRNMTFLGVHSKLQAAFRKEA